MSGLLRSSLRAAWPCCYRRRPAPERGQRHERDPDHGESDRCGHPEHVDQHRVPQFRVNFRRQRRQLLHFRRRQPRQRGPERLPPQRIVGDRCAPRRSPRRRTPPPARRARARGRKTAACQRASSAVSAGGCLQRLQHHAIALGQLHQRVHLLRRRVRIEPERRAGSSANPTGACLSTPSVPRKSRSPSALTSPERSAIPSAVATALQVTPAQATSASSSMSPEHSSSPPPPVTGCSPATASARPVSTLQAICASSSAPRALSVMRAASRVARGNGPSAAPAGRGVLRRSLAGPPCRRSHSAPRAQMSLAALARSR